MSIYIYIYIYLSSVDVPCVPTVTLWTVACQAPLSMEFSSKNTGVGSHALLQRIFPNQGSNPCCLCLLHFWQILYQLSHQGSKIPKGKVCCSFFSTKYNKLDICHGNTCFTYVYSEDLNVKQCCTACMLSCFSHVPPTVIPWTVALWAPLSMEFSRQECWSRMPFPLPGIFQT